MSAKDQERVGLVVVDDEEIQRRALIQQIEAAFPEAISLVEAGNGAEALEELEVGQGQIFLMDLHMPVMDGLKATEAIRRKDPSAQVVILTAYDEFEYARQAVKLGVTEYLLKPINRAELEEILAKALAVRETEMSQRWRNLRMRQQLEKAIPLIRQQFLQDLVGGGLSDKTEVEARARFLNMNRLPTVAMAVQIDQLLESNEMEETERQFLKRQVLDSISKALEELVSPQNDALVGTVLGDQIAALVPVDESDHSRIVEMADVLRLRIEEDTGISATIGVGLDHSPLGIERSFREARLACTQAALEQQGVTADFADLAASGHTVSSYPRQLENHILEYVRLGHRSGARRILERLLPFIIDAGEGQSGGGTSPVHTMAVGELQPVSRLHLLELAVLVSRAALEGGGDESRLEQLSLAFMGQARGRVPLARIVTLIRELVDEATAAAQLGRKTHQESLVEKALAFIGEGFQEDINLEDAAASVHVSPGYLSHLLKEATNATFTEHLTGLRIAAAKELLMKTDMMVSQVAAEVGYHDANYFSRVFKKETGCSPSAFRDGKDGDDDEPAEVGGA